MGLVYCLEFRAYGYVEEVNLVKRPEFNSLGFQCGGFSRMQNSGHGA